jgi:hypothetical protein
VVTKIQRPGPKSGKIHENRIDEKWREALRRYPKHAGVWEWDPEAEEFRPSRYYPERTEVGREEPVRRECAG